jgi:hypothetical protein
LKENSAVKEQDLESNCRDRDDEIKNIKIRFDKEIAIFK